MFWSCIKKAQCPSDDILWRALEYKVEGKQKRGQLKITWKQHMVLLTWKQHKQNMIRNIGLRIEDAVDRKKWRGVRAIA